MSKNYDVAIIGAGPAGVACALSLRNSGLKVVVLDKHDFPRDKTCGDAIPGPGLKYLKKILPEMELEFAQFESKQKLTSTHLYVKNSKPIEIVWKSKAYNSSRLAFDNFLVDLLKKYGKADLIFNHSLHEVERSHDGFQLTCTDGEQINCKLAIACDGTNSMFSKIIKNDVYSENKGLGLRVYYKNVDAPRDANEIYALDDFKGYLWIFPIEKDLFNVGIGISGDLAATGYDLKKAFSTALKTHPVLSKKFQNAEAVSKLVGFKLAMGGSEEYEISGDHFMLCGDAAFLVDPLQGHGIDKAILSGSLAAEQAIASFSKEDFSTEYISNYDKKVYAALGKELKKNHQIVQLLSKRQWLLRILYLASRLNTQYLIKLFYGSKPRKPQAQV